MPAQGAKPNTLGQPTEIKAVALGYSVETQKPVMLCHISEVDPIYNDPYIASALFNQDPQSAYAQWNREGASCSIYTEPSTVRNSQVGYPYAMKRAFINVQATLTTADRILTVAQANVFDHTLCPISIDARPQAGTGVSITPTSTVNELYMGGKAGALAPMKGLMNIVAGAFNRREPNWYALFLESANANFGGKSDVTAKLLRLMLFMHHKILRVTVATNGRDANPWSDAVRGARWSAISAVNANVPLQWPMSTRVAAGTAINAWCCGIDFFYEWQCGVRRPAAAGAPDFNQLWDGWAVVPVSRQWGSQISARAAGILSLISLEWPYLHAATDQGPATLNDVEGAAIVAGLTDVTARGFENWCRVFGARDGIVFVFCDSADDQAASEQRAVNLPAAVNVTMAANALTDAAGVAVNIEPAILDTYTQAETADFTNVWNFWAINQPDEAARGAFLVAMAAVGRYSPPGYSMPLPARSQTAANAATYGLGSTIIRAQQATAIANTCSGNLNSALAVPIMDGLYNTWKTCYGTGCKPANATYGYGTQPSFTIPREGMAEIMVAAGHEVWNGTTDFLRKFRSVGEFCLAIERAADKTAVCTTQRFAMMGFNPINFEGVFTTNRDVWLLNRASWMHALNIYFKDQMGTRITAVGYAAVSNASQAGLWDLLVNTILTNRDANQEGVFSTGPASYKDVFPTTCLVNGFLYDVMTPVEENSGMVPRLRELEPIDFQGMSTQAVDVDQVVALSPQVTGRYLQWAFTSGTWGRFVRWLYGVTKTFGGVTALDTATTGYSLVFMFYSNGRQNTRLALATPTYDESAWSWVTSNQNFNTVPAAYYLHQKGADNVEREFHLALALSSGDWQATNLRMSLDYQRRVSGGRTLTNFRTSPFGTQSGSVWSSAAVPQATAVTAANLLRGFAERTLLA